MAGPSRYLHIHEFRVFGLLWRIKNAPDQNRVQIYCLKLDLSILSATKRNNEKKWSKNGQIMNML